MKFMSKKVFLGIITLLCFVLVLAGCENGNSKSDTDDSAKQTISIFNIKTETAKQLKTLAKEYEKKHKNIKIEVTTVGGGQDASSALQAKFSSGDEPSLFQVGGIADIRKWENKLADLSNDPLTKLAIKGTTEGSTLNGKIYGEPLNIEGFGLLYNKEIFQKAGINTDDITSYDTFVAAVQKLDSQKSQLGLDAVFGFSGKENWVVQQFSSFFVGPEFDNSLKKTADAKTIDFKYGNQFKKYTDLINKYNVQPILSLDYSTSVEQDFTNGKVAIIHQGNWIVPTLDQQDKSFAKNKLGILPLYVGAKDKGYIAAGPSWYWSVNKDKGAANVKATKAFLKWMYTDKNAMKSITTDFQYVPAYKNFKAKSIADPTGQQIFETVSNGNTIPWVHSNEPTGWAQQEFFPVWQQYVNKKVTWNQLEKTTAKLWKTDRENGK